MQQNFSKRLEALESKDAKPFRLLWLNQGETEQQARERMGISAVDSNLFVLRWLGLDMQKIADRNKDGCTYGSNDANT